MPLYIVGNGAHGRDIYDSLVPFGEVYLLDDDPARCRDRWPDYPVKFVAGINDPTKRRKVAERLEADGWEPFDDGVWLSSLANLVPTTVHVGRHTHINGGVFAVRATIGDYCTIAPGVTICGDVTIGNEVFVGAGATICNRVTIEDGATIGAGATVLPNTTVPAGKTYVGTPARQVIR